MRPDARPDRSVRPPRAWIASARDRRLTFVAALLPGGAMAVAGAQILVAPGLMLAGLAWLALAVLVRRVSEPRFLAREARATAGEPPLPQESLP